MGVTPVTAVLITRDPKWPRGVPWPAQNFPFQEVLFEPNCPNVRRRFELAQTAKHDLIYVQDDDCALDIHALFARYNGHLTNAITLGHNRMYAGTGMTLIGWGAFFRKSQIDFSRWERQYGEVDAMEADRIFTYLHQPHNPVIMPIHQFNLPVKMCRRPGHYQRRDQILKMLRAL